MNTSTAERGQSRRNNTQRRPHGPISGPAPLTQRRRRSRSPEAQNPAEVLHNLVAGRPGPHPESTKRKKPGNPSLPSLGSRSFLVAVDDATTERGRKPKGKPRTHNRHLAENPPPAGTSRAPETFNSIKRDRSKSRESPRLPSKPTTSEVEGSGRDPDMHSEYTGPLAAGEFAKIKRELDTFKKLAHENKKTIKKQTKVIEDLKQQDHALKQKLKESESQISKLQSKTKKADEALTTVENNSQCQICMELLYRPYALSPCGHILCVACLQEWFRRAPPVDDEMFDDSDPDYLLRRRKTCPCCRTHVRHRPIPVFMVKGIVAAIAKAKGLSQTATTSGREPTSNDSDPWEGLFPDDDEEIDDYAATDDDGEDDDEDEDEDEDEEDSSWYDDVFSYGSGSDEESYQGGYIHPQWEPPSVVIDEEDYLFEQLDEGDLDCLRRGATIGMIHEFDVQYRHDEGLIVRDENFNRIYLGWNIRLSADDENGEAYMRYIAEDMLKRPERWSIIEMDDGGYDAHLLVAEDEVYEYRDTDSANYMDVDDLD